ncbi:Fatty-acid-CoA ligase, partial [Phytophthora palmivora]
MKLLNWHKLANEAALKAAIIKTNKIKQEDSQFASALTQGERDERVQRAQQIIEEEQLKPLQVNTEFFRNLEAKGQRDEAKLDDDVRRHIQHLRKLKESMAQREDMQRRRQQYREKMLELQGGGNGTSRSKSMLKGQQGSNQDEETNPSDKRDRGNTSSVYHRAAMAAGGKAALDNANVVTSLDKLMELEQRIRHLEDAGLAVDDIADARDASAAALGARYTKRQRESEESTAPARKKRRLKKDSAVQLKHPVVVANGVAINTEPVIAELKRRATSDKWRHKIVYTFLDDLGRETVNLSFEDVDRAARKVAAALQRDAHVVKGDRVMLCFPPGLDFALAFWGCLYAGVVGIPVYPPYPGTLSKDLPKFNRLVEDSGAAVVLTNTTYHLASKMATVKGYFSTDRTSWPPNLQWITTDNLADSLVAQYDEEDALSLTHKDVAFF